jgi:predicted short-subunit dehydrogenase-like oxidoreductase (DUF2520 family)
MNLGIIGGGRAAWALGNGWRRAGRRLAGVTLRSGSASDVPHRLGVPALSEPELIASSELILLALPDGALETVAPRIASLAPPATLVFHPSGSTGSSVFGRRPGAFSLHPLRSLPPVGEPVDFSGTLFVYEGGPDPREAARGIATGLGGSFAEIPAPAKALYHASAVLGSNGVAALLEAAAELFARCGLEGPEIQRAVAGLAHSAVANWESSGERFTGPVARGETATVARHLAALSGADRERGELYRRLALEIALAVRRRGAHSSELTEIISLLRTHPLS